VRLNNKNRYVEPVKRVEPVRYVEPERVEPVYERTYP
jgi:hypothetical protein